MSLERHLNAAIDLLQADATLPARINKERAVAILCALKGLLTEFGFGTTPQDDHVLAQVGVIELETRRLGIHPALIRLLLHYHIKTVPPRECVTYQQGTEKLLRLGLIEASSSTGSGYHTTEAGVKLIRLMEEQF